MCLEALNNPSKVKGLQVIWVTPLRALAKDIHSALQQVCDDVNLEWEIALRTGDTSQVERKRQKANMPQTIVTTPESIHVLLSQKDARKTFGNVKAVIVGRMARIDWRKAWCSDGTCHGLHETVERGSN